MSQKKKPAHTKKMTSIGGQALIEGVMMRGPKKTAMAVRHTSGEIVMEDWATSGQDRAKIWKAPFIRGIYNMIDSMRFGYKCLMRSAELSGLEEEEKPSKKKETAAAASPISENRTSNSAQANDTVSSQPESAQTFPVLVPAPITEDCFLPDDAERPEGYIFMSQGSNNSEDTVITVASPVKKYVPSKKEAKAKKREDLLMTFLMVFSSVLGVALSIGLFIYLPTWLFSLMKHAVPSLDHNRFIQSGSEGVMRIILFVGYILAVSLMKDIRRVFMYHGAEHKSIFCYEAGEELTVENVRKQSRFHPRCGTSFLILMLLVGIFISMLIPVTDQVMLRAAIKLLCIPLVVGIGYELIKLAGRKNNLFTRTISAPGLWMQRITTKEPDDSMIECAIAALKAVIPANQEEDKW